MRKFATIAQGFHCLDPNRGIGFCRTRSRKPKREQSAVIFVRFTFGFRNQFDQCFIQGIEIGDVVGFLGNGASVVTDCLLYISGFHILIAGIKITLRTKNNLVIVNTANK